MTRDERAAKRAQRLKEKLAATQQELAQFERQQREVRRQDLNKRRYAVGALADEAGLFPWSNAELVALFQVLARLRDTPDPVKVLDGLLTEIIAQR